MRNLLFAALVLPSTVYGQVIACPDYIPSTEILSKGRPGNVRLLPVSLSFAYVHAGELYSDQLEAPPGSTKVNGELRTTYRLDHTRPTWLVCIYGGNEWKPGKQMVAGIVEWWGKVDRAATSCVLAVKEIKPKSMPTSWKATAACK